MKKVCVIGGGAAGLMAAYAAAENGHRVILFEKNEKLGKKIYITGKGRCNFTNDVPADEFLQNVVRGKKFLTGAIYEFPPQKTIDFFENNGLSVKIERGNRVFPVSDNAVDIVLALKKFCLQNGVRIVTERVIDWIKNEEGTPIGVVSEKQRHFGFDAFILCTGGVSYPVTGSTGDGYELAQSVGHTVKPTVPSLVGLNSDSEICAASMGLALKNVAVSVTDTVKKKVIYKDFGEMLFCHFGISGPMILSASAHLRPMEKNRYSISIDLKPALDMQTLDKRLLSDFEKNKNRNFANAFDALLPAKLREPFIKLTGIAPDKKINAVTAEERRRVAALIKGIPVSVTGFRPITEAIVTSGGVSVKEIEPQTMRSKKCPKLYFAGEVMDLDAYTGGFNLQIAFCTAYTAALSAASDL